MMLSTLDEVMPIPSATKARGGRWPEAARAYIYEGLNQARALGALIGMSAARVRTVRSLDKWRDFAALASSRKQAEAYGLSVPFLLGGASVAAEIEQERDSRADRARAMRAELATVQSLMQATTDKASQRYARLLRAVGSLRAEIESLLGLDVARRVGTSAMIDRAKLAARRGPARRPAFLESRANGARDVDLSALPPLE